ncbi:isoaspartyl peptidase/L-asparaginase [Nematostella vectensis]|uniref:isoaspartyl peptidase/L-asparaginase n=1 Tax=Nematostella vectensis TaxID=45351 RepID=UPI0013905AAE|nr:isoaspartyl peptidase/L-asparaginase [Nematostella vectensis]
MDEVFCAGPISPCIVVHGGASSLSESIIFPMLINGVKKAARTGYGLLMKGGKNASLDAVEAAVKVLEDIAVFNAGHGSKLNNRGEVEMDAMIMDGRDLNVGGVGGISGVSNPISVARKVMTESNHCLLIGEGANMFADEQGIPRIPPEALITEARRRQLARAMEAMEIIDMSDDESDSSDEPEAGPKSPKSPSKQEKKKLLRQESIAGLKKVMEEIRGKELHDTVGAVAVDSFGNVACATSTGGLTAVHPGRVGDSPIVGCGGYADNQVAAASSTGTGEMIMRVNLARYALFMIQIGQTAADAAAAALRYMEQRVGGRAGIIIVSRDGEAGIAFNTEHMPWAQVKNGVTSYGLKRGEVKTVKKGKTMRGESIVESPGRVFPDIGEVGFGQGSDMPMDSDVVSVGMQANEDGVVHVNKSGPVN